MKRILAMAVCAALALAAAACGGDEAEGGEPEDVETTAPAGPVWISEGGVEVGPGDCFNQTQPSGDGPTVYEVVPCDGPHDAEATHVEDCAMGTPGGDVEAANLAAAAAYVGVDPEGFIDWLGEQDLYLLMNWDLNGPSLCFLKGTDGRDLIASYAG